MPILSTDIQVLYASGQTALTGQVGTRTTGAAGGNISTTQVTDNTLNNLFPDVTGDQAAAGVTLYCKVFVKNTNGTLTWQNVKGWISALTPGGDNTLAIALEASANDLTPPVSGSFSTPTTKVAGLALGSIASNAAVGVWVRWVINAGATAKAAAAGTMRFEGDTAA
jgi:hypothetical protein